MNCFFLSSGIIIGSNFFIGSCTLVVYVQGFLILYFSGKQVGKQMHFNNDKTYLDSAAERSHSRCFKFITDIRTYVEEMVQGKLINGK